MNDSIEAKKVTFLFHPLDIKIDRNWSNLLLLEYCDDYDVLVSEIITSKLYQFLGSIIVYQGMIIINYIRLLHCSQT